MKPLNRKWKRSNEKVELQRSDPPPTTVEQNSAYKEHFAWQTQEDLLEEALPEGKKVKGSGCSSRRDRKGDVLGGEWLGESKTTSKKSLSVKCAWLRKITAEAKNVGKLPVFNFGFDKNKDREREDWLAFKYKHAKLLVGIYNAVRKGELERAARYVRMLER